MQRTAGKALPDGDRVHDAQRVGEAVAGCTGLRGGFEHRLQGVAAGAGRVLAAERDLQPLGARIADHVPGGGHDGAERTVELGGNLLAGNRARIG